MGQPTTSYTAHSCPISREKASIAIDDGRVLAGDFPPRQLRMVQVWIDIHRDELMADWELAVAGDEPFRIAPLQ
jgi:Domain of unknown function (DUF4160)